MKPVYIRRSLRQLPLLLAIIALAATTARAQESVNWSVIGSGGIAGASNGEIAMSATLGQPVIGPAGQAPSPLHQGFWLPLRLVASIPFADGDASTSNAFALRNSPNPFVVATAISYALPAAAHVRLEIIDLRGRRVATLIDGLQTGGEHRADWDGRSDRGDALASGAYVSVLSVELVARPGGPVIAQQKMLLMQ